MAAAATFYRIAAPDYWFHLGAGRSIAEHGLPSREAWCLSARGQAALLAGWPYQVGLHEVHRLGADLGVALWRAGWVALAAALAFALLRVMGAASWTACLLVPLVVAASRDALRVRPEQALLVLVLFALLELERARRGPKDRTRRLIPAQVIWANTHPAWVIGPLLAWIYSITEPPARSRTWMVLGLVLWAASAVNPTPLITLATPFRFLMPFQLDALHASNEMLRRWSWSHDRFDPFTGLALLWFLAALIGGRRVWRAAPGLGLVSILMMALGFYSAQFRDVASWVALAPIAIALTPSLSGASSRLRAAPALAAGILGAFALVSSSRFPLGIAPDRSALPVQAVALADSMRLKGAALHAVAAGGYILAVRGDAHPPLVDVRLRGDPGFLRRYQGALRTNPELDSFLDEWKLSHVVAPPPRGPGDQLATNVSRRLEWALVSYDDGGLLFVRWRDHPEVADRAYRYLTPDLVTMTAMIARAPRDSGLSQRLEAELLRARASSPRHARASTWLGLLALANSRRQEALRHLEEAERIAPDTPRLANALGRAYAAVGQTEKSKAAFERGRRERAEEEAALDSEEES